MPYKRLFIGDSVFLFYRSGGDKIIVQRCEWDREYPPGANPKLIDEKFFDSEAHLESCLKNLFFTWR